VPFNVQCPGCRKTILLSDQQVGQTISCPDCGLMFATRAAPQHARPTAQGVARPSPVGTGSAPGTSPRPQPAPAPPADNGNDDQDVLPGWDEAAVNALLGSSSPAPAAPAPAAAPAAAPSSAKGPSRSLSAVGFGRLDIGAATSVGRVRNRNEDSYLVHHMAWSNRNQGHEVALAIVADGLGGHQGGDQASGLAITIISNNLAQLINAAVMANASNSNPQALAQAVDAAIKSANLAIFSRAQNDSSLRGMASTIAVVVIWDGHVVIGHVGDTRVYHFRQGTLTQVTKDQTLVAKMVEMGHLTPEQARTHPARNEVAQAVGLHREIEPAPYQLRLAPGEWLIVACDGLHTHVDARNLEQSLRTALPAASYLANNLVDLANQGGGTDNTTVVAIRCY
jgi:protein phosphatase